MRTIVRAEVQRNFAYDSIDLYVTEKSGDITSLMTNATMETVQEGVMPEPAFIHLSPESAQLLMDSLWNVGVRPSDNRDISEILNANREHIADLRKVAFDLLKKVIKND